MTYAKFEVELFDHLSVYDWCLIELLKIDGNTQNHLIL